MEWSAWSYLSLGQAERALGLLEPDDVYARSLLAIRLVQAGESDPDLVILHDLPEFIRRFGKVEK